MSPTAIPGVEIEFEAVRMSADLSCFSVKNAVEAFRRANASCDRQGGIRTVRALQALIPSAITNNPTAERDRIENPAIPAAACPLNSCAARMVMASLPTALKKIRRLAKLARSRGRWAANTSKQLWGMSMIV